MPHASDTPPPTLSYAGATEAGPRLRFVLLSFLYGISVGSSAFGGAVCYQRILNPASSDDSLAILLILAIFVTAIGTVSFGFTLFALRRRPHARLQPLVSILLGTGIGLVPAVAFALSDQGFTSDAIPFANFTLPLAVFGYSPLAAVIVAHLNRPHH